jgi:hypothetical protein
MHARHRLLLPLLPLPCAAAGASVLRIGSWNRDQEPTTRAVESLLGQAYAELGQPVQFVERPLRRALVELLEGELDGNLMRAAAVIAEHGSQLLRVDPAVLLLHFWSYSLRPLPAPAHWAELASRRVAMLRGVLLIERQLPASTRRLEAATVPELHRLVDQGVADLALTAESRLAPPLLNLLERQLCGFAPAALHHVLRQAHAELAQRLAALLASWQVSGRLEALLRAKLL